MWESASSARATRLPLALTVKALVMWEQNSTEMPQLWKEVPPLRPAFSGRNHRQPPLPRAPWGRAPRIRVDEPREAP